ncbi:MAG: hypothetical protein K1X44_06405 [Alphaproteobacteria bacterium]|nr:hypothetical protein [Alphaproteobacteria bacterium]
MDFGTSSEAISLNAEDGIEWRREEKVYIAKGHASASRGKYTIQSDIITAHYRDKNNKGGTQIWRVEAKGNVKLTTDQESIVGDNAFFDFDKGVLVITGKSIEAKTNTITVRAHDQLEYWNKRNVLVAKGNAVGQRENQTIESDVLTFYFINSTQNTKLSQIEALGNVRIKTKSEVAYCDKFIYNVSLETATLNGNVRVTQGKSQVNGDYAEINMKTGVSSIRSNPDSKNRGKVNSLIIPN